MRKHLRLPNGFGQITEIKNKRLRNPYRVMVTVGKDQNGKPICKLLKPKAYFHTYNEAYIALVEYNKDPYSLEEAINVDELFNRWLEEYKSTRSSASLRSVLSVWTYCDNLKEMKVTEVRSRHLKEAIETASSPTTKQRLKAVLDMMFDYALEYELVTRNYARDFKLSPEVAKEKERNRKEHQSFTEEEMAVLWANTQNVYVNIMLIQCYSGWRPNELLELKTENINLEEGWMRGGKKTTAGKNRVVPIHSRIKPLIEKYYNPDNEYLFNVTYDQYRHNITALVPNHRPHDGRVQFVTMCKAAGVDEYAIKIMVGHTINDITEKIYTRRPLSFFKDEIEKIV